jgi:hypothetical protein
MNEGQTAEFQKFLVISIFSGGLANPVRFCQPGKIAVSPVLQTEWTFSALRQPNVTN